MSAYDLAGLYDFLMQTPEKGLRGMLVDNKPMTEVHFNMLLKIARASKQEEFVNFCDKEEFPKIKFGPAEIKLKEKFWKDCLQGLNSRGLLGPAMPMKIAA